MTSLILEHKSRDNAPQVPLFDGVGLLLGRVHEICGPSRIVMAAGLAGKMQGPVIWIRSRWTVEQIYPLGLAQFMDPGRVIYVKPDPGDALLWSMEESLRSGAVPTVICELPTPPALTPIRRLNIAAAAGAEITKVPPLALILTTGDGGAQGVESRWHMAPTPANPPQWHLIRSRSRMAPIANWQVDYDNGFRVREN